MAGTLSPAEITAFERDGILFPLPVLSAAEAAESLDQLEAIEAREGGRLIKSTNTKPHLLIPWINELVRHPRILNAVESLIGPDILCWGCGFFSKAPNDGTYITWHQDSTYWGLSGPDVVTAWVALTPSTPQSGCMQVIPGTHLRDQVPHRDTYAEGNLLSRGQEIEVDVDLAEAVDVVLQPGEMSLHHVRIFHGSDPNLSTRRRTGLAIRYIPTRISQTGGTRTSAFLVRGVDRFGHFDPEPVPVAAFSEEAVRVHAAATAQANAILLASTM